MTPSPDLISFPDQLPEFWETLTFAGILKDVMKDTDEQSDEEIHRVRSGRVLSPEASVPMEMECIPLLVWMWLRHESSLNTIILGFYRGLLR